MSTGYVSPAPRVGSKWTPGYRPAREIAADIRRDVKAAQRDGIIPADVKVSVRTHNFAGGSSIDVTLSGWDHERVYAMNGVAITWEAANVRDRVEAIRRSYNRDASDSMVDYWDVTFYGSTTWAR